MRWIGRSLGVGLLAVAVSACGTKAAVGPSSTAPTYTYPTAPPDTTPATAVTAPAPTTPTTEASPYPRGEQGDQDFAVSSIQETDDGLGDIGGTIRITNVGAQSYSVGFTVTFFRTADENSTPIGSADGSAENVEPGQTVTETMVSEDTQFTGTFYYQFQVNSEF